MMGCRQRVHVCAGMPGVTWTWLVKRKMKFTGQASSQGSFAYESETISTRTRPSNPSRSIGIVPQNEGSTDINNVPHVFYGRIVLAIFQKPLVRAKTVGGRKTTPRGTKAVVIVRDLKHSIATESVQCAMISLMLVNWIALMHVYNTDRVFVLGGVLCATHYWLPNA